MRRKYLLILAAILLIFGLPNISQPYAKIDDFRTISEIFNVDRESKIVAENGTVLRCSMQSKKSSIRQTRDQAVIISVNSNLICR